MGRVCPVCGKGMFRAKALKEHIRVHHPDYYDEHIRTGTFSFTKWCEGLKRNNIALPKECVELLGEG